MAETPTTPAATGYFTKPAPADPTPEAPQHSDDPALEQRARLMGWRPQEEFKGEEGKWKPADEFVQFAQDNPAVLNERLGRMERMLQDQAKKAVAEQRKAAEAGYKRAVLEHRKAIAAAVDDGDQVRADELAQRMAQIKPPPPEEREDPNALPGFQAFAASEPWYGTDAVLTGFANNTLAPQLASAGYDTTSPEFFQEVSRQMREAFPHKFSNPRRSAPAAVANGGGAPARAGGKDYRSLPPEAKAACDDYVARGLLKADDYVKTYFGDA